MRIENHEEWSKIDATRRLRYHLRILTSYETDSYSHKNKDETRLESEEDLPKANKQR